MPRSASEKIGNAVAYVGVLLVNFLANAVPLGGRTTGQISDTFPSMFTPAGFTFSIWGVIYLLLLGFVIRQALDIEHESASLSRIGGLFKSNCLANAGWIFAWHYGQLILSLAIMLVILWTLVRIFLVLQADPAIRSGWSFVLLVLPFSVYFGWITVATLANVSVVQAAFGMNDLIVPEVIWTVLKLGVAGACAAMVAWKYSDAAYPLVVAWAAFGITMGRSDNPVVEGVAIVIAVVAICFGVLALVRTITARRSNGSPRANPRSQRDGSG